MSQKISQMTAAGTMTGTELLEVSQRSTTVTITAATLSAAASDNSYNDSGSGFVAAGFAVGDTVVVSGFTGNAANNINSGTITALTTAKMTIGGTDGNVIVDDAAGESVTITKWNTRRTTAQDVADLAVSGAGAIVQVVNTQTGAVATGTTVLPIDDTIPQNTEGDEYLTRAITPTSATNKLRIDVVMSLGCGTASRAISVALFQDTTANALAAVQQWQVTAGGNLVICLTHFMTAGTTSPTTFKVRAGPNAAGTVTLNGSAGTRQFGGVSASSITISEIVP